jgi:hypothetical protein
MVAERKRTQIHAAAEEAAEAVRLILEEHYPGAPWIHQLTEMVKHATHNGINQLKTASYGENQVPFSKGGQHRFPARTREQILASPAVQADLRKEGWKF